jgi:catechol 2,3-dioxygenase-like lactoylglutathione lyase family enzyme
MFDHVTIRVSDLAASRVFYERVFPGVVAWSGAEGAEWGDFSIVAAGGETPTTRNLHVGFRAESRAHVDRWWQSLVDAGYRDDGEPGPRPQYGPEYYGGFVLDPDGNSVEAVHNQPLCDDMVDHLWLRVRDVEASRRFYETAARVVGFEARPLDDGRVHFRDAGGSFSILEDTPTQNLHVAFVAPDRETVDAFHRALVGAGYRDNGAPGERPVYHPGYYGAFVLDPDGNNVEAVFHDR